jgi:hypothetical protein
MAPRQLLIPWIAAVGTSFSPPTVPGQARLRGYQRPPRGGRGRCRRACERTPSVAAAAAPAAGAYSLMLEDYEKRVVSIGLVLRLASPSSRQQLAKEYAVLPAEDPLLHWSGGKVQRHDPDSRHFLQPRQVASTLERLRPPP